MAAKAAQHRTARTVARLSEGQSQMSTALADAWAISDYSRQVSDMLDRWRESVERARALTDGATPATRTDTWVRALVTEAVAWRRIATEARDLAPPASAATLALAVRNWATEIDAAGGDVAVGVHLADDAAFRTASERLDRAGALVPNIVEAAKRLRLQLRDETGRPRRPTRRVSGRR